MDEVRRRILAYMAGHITMTLATSSAEGQPRATTLFYANDGLDIFFLSSPGSLHCQQALANPRVAVTISQDYADWRGIQGIQLTGQALPLEDSAHARSVYLAKYPFAGSFPPSDAAYWKIVPRWVRMVDNTLGFAHKDEIDLTG
ncbi:MAG: pyridoxamine 5'-phosphate oxidase family protein [Chloroflexota bacterium]